MPDNMTTSSCSHFPTGITIKCQELISYYLSPESNPSGAEPVPYSALFNEVQNASLKVEPDKTYLVRIISMAAFAQVS